MVNDCFWEQASDGGQNVGDVPLADGWAVLHALWEDEPMVSSEWGLFVKRGDGEGEPWCVLGMERDVKETVFNVYDG